MPRDSKTWWASQIKKWGSEEAVREAYRGFGNRGEKVGQGYFYHLKRKNPRLLKQISSKGGKSEKVTAQEQDSSEV